MQEYERWETRFAAPEHLFGTEPNAFLRAQQALLPKTGRALAVADGQGRNGVWLAQQGLDVLSVDFSPTAQRRARELAAERGVHVEFDVADLSAWTWPREAFDVVAVIFAQPVAALTLFAGVRTALRTGGLLLLEGYTPRQIAYATGGPSDVERLYTRELLEREFASFSSRRIDEYDAEIWEGPGHGGMSALIDLVATK